jgi:glycosyltransferase involved in cell wall biosynthesis
MKVRIYAPHVNRPEFIRIQLASIRAHLLDDWEYIVVNDAINEPYIYNFLEKGTRDSITHTCEELSVQCLEFPQDLHTNRDTLFPKLQFFGNNPSTRASDVYQWALNHSLDFDGLVVIMDGDMFFVKDVSLVQKMEKANLAFLPQCREGIEYPWLNLVSFYPKLTPNIRDFSYDCGSVNGVALDSGGMSYYYLQDNKENLIIRHISQERISSENQQAFHLNETFMKDYETIPSNSDAFPDFEYLDDCILHYGGGSNWNSDPVLFHQMKTKTLLEYFGASLFHSSKNQMTK